MSCGYACVNCGKCKGVARPLRCEGICPACGTVNDEGAATCAVCGMPIPPRPGRRRSAGAAHEGAPASGASDGAGFSRN